MHRRHVQRGRRRGKARRGGRGTQRHVFVAARAVRRAQPDQQPTIRRPLHEHLTSALGIQRNLVAVQREQRAQRGALPLAGDVAGELERDGGRPRAAAVRRLSADPSQVRTAGYQRERPDLCKGNADAVRRVAAARALVDQCAAGAALSNFANLQHVARKALAGRHRQHQLALRVQARSRVFVCGCCSRGRRAECEPTGCRRAGCGRHHQLGSHEPGLQGLAVQRDVQRGGRGFQQHEPGAGSGLGRRRRGGGQLELGRAALRDCTLHTVAQRQRHASREVQDHALRRRQRRAGRQRLDIDLEQVVAGGQVNEVQATIGVGRDVVAVVGVHPGAHQSLLALVLLAVGVVVAVDLAQRNAAVEQRVGLHQQRSLGRATQGTTPRVEGLRHVAQCFADTGRRQHHRLELQGDFATRDQIQPDRLPHRRRHPANGQQRRLQRGDGPGQLQSVARKRQQPRRVGHQPQTGRQHIAQLGTAGTRHRVGQQGRGRVVDQLDGDVNDLAHRGLGLGQVNGDAHRLRQRVHRQVVVARRHGRTGLRRGRVLRRRRRNRARLLQREAGQVLGQRGAGLGQRLGHDQTVPVQRQQARLWRPRLGREGPTGRGHRHADAVGVVRRGREQVGAGRIGALALLAGRQRVGGHQLAGREGVALVVEQVQQHAGRQCSGRGVVHAAGGAQRQVHPTVGEVLGVDRAVQVHGAVGRAHPQPPRSVRHRCDAEHALGIGDRCLQRPLLVRDGPQLDLIAGEYGVCSVLIDRVIGADVLEHRAAQRALTDHRAQGNASWLGLGGEVLPATPPVAFDHRGVADHLSRRRLGIDAQPHRHCHRLACVHRQTVQGQRRRLALVRGLQRYLHARRCLYALGQQVRDLWIEDPLRQRIRQPQVRQIGGRQVVDRHGVAQPVAGLHQTAVLVLRDLVDPQRGGARANLHHRGLVAVAVVVVRVAGLGVQTLGLQTRLIADGRSAHHPHAQLDLTHRAGGQRTQGEPNDLGSAVVPADVAIHRIGDRLAVEQQRTRHVLGVVGDRVLEGHVLRRRLTSIRNAHQILQFFSRIRRAVAVGVQHLHGLASLVQRGAGAGDQLCGANRRGRRTVGPSGGGVAYHGARRDVGPHAGAEGDGRGLVDPGLQHARLTARRLDRQPQRQRRLARNLLDRLTIDQRRARHVIHTGRHRVDQLHARQRRVRACHQLDAPPHDVARQQRAARLVLGELLRRFQSALHPHRHGRRIAHDGGDRVVAGLGLGQRIGLHLRLIRDDRAVAGGGPHPDLDVERDLSAGQNRQQSRSLCFRPANRRQPGPVLHELATLTDREHLQQRVDGVLNRHMLRRRAALDLEPNAVAQHVQRADLAAVDVLHGLVNRQLGHRSDLDRRRFGLIGQLRLTLARRRRRLGHRAVNRQRPHPQPHLQHHVGARRNRGELGGVGRRPPHGAALSVPSGTLQGHDIKHLLVDARHHLHAGRRLRADRPHDHLQRHRLTGLHGRKSWRLRNE